MLRENTAFAQKIIDFYTDKGVECSVVDEHLSLLVTLSLDGTSHEFRYGGRAFAENHHSKKFRLVLERELAKLRSASSAPAEDRGRPRARYRGQENAAEEGL